VVALVWLDPGDPFPPTSEALADPPGLLAAGGDLSPGTLLRAYRQGIFPWFSEGDPILWWTLSPRLVLSPDQFHASRSLRKALRRTPWQYAIDQRFADVIQHCAAVPRAGQPGTWISPAMQQAYLRLHQLGHAHSVEIYRDGQLVGGLYGVCLGQAFFGESMFSLESDASKVALHTLCQLHTELDIALVDCQMETPHLMSLGARSLDRQTFEQALARHQQRDNRGLWPRPRSPLPALAGGID